MSDIQPRATFEGFWFPQALRDRVLTGATWERLWLKRGEASPLVSGGIAGEDDPDGIEVRWPKLAPDQWDVLLEGLQHGRTVSGRQVLARWQAVLDQARTLLVERSADMLPVLASCTGYSPQMILMALGLGDLINPQLLSAALEFQPTWAAATDWQQMPGLPGRTRFFPQRTSDRATARLRGNTHLCRPAPSPDLVLGYAAGNVPGTALLIALLGGLANYDTNDETPSPAVMVRNSRHEPLFAPWVLSVIEALDPALVAGLAVLVWDYADEALQSKLMRHAGLMVAAAGDDTIAALDEIRGKSAPALRFHRHGHKVSFAVSDVPSLKPEIPLLSALDSVLWDQNGCLSARVHLVTGDADEYALALVERMRAFSTVLPRGATPRRLTHRAFDTYAAMTHSGRVRVCSAFDDDFAVVVDAREWDAEALQRTVNACQGRVVVVRPIKDVMDVPGYMRWLPASNLQSVSVAMDQARVLEFAQAVGACGVTAVRSLGRAAFPQLAYSWDGLLPLDVGQLRPEGHFTTVEFDDLEREMSETARRWMV
jgi:hypothetical protein